MFVAFCYAGPDGDPGVERPGTSPQVPCLFGPTLCLPEKRQGPEGVRVVERRRLVFCGVEGQRLLVAGLGLGQSSGTAMRIGEVPDGVGEEHRVGCFSRDGDRFLVAPDGVVAAAGVVLHVTQPSQRGHERARVVGPARKGHGLSEPSSDEV